MKMLFATAFLAMTVFASQQSAHAQILTGNTGVLINKVCVDGCMIGSIPGSQP